MSTRLRFDTYLSHLRAESRRFREVLTSCDPALTVPACPDWDVDDLLWHLGEVQQFWAGVVSSRPAGPTGEERPRSDGDHDDLLARFDVASAALVAALESADPDEAAWTWSSDQTVGFTMRRQALEALIHRLDAEQAVGDVTPLDAALCLDGVAEVIGVMFGGHPAWGHFEPAPQWVRLEADDLGRSAWVQLGIFSGTDPDSDTSYADEPDVALVDDPGTEADVVISGPAEVLLAWLWRRTDAAALTVSGDPGVYDRFRKTVNNPIN